MSYIIAQDLTHAVDNANTDKPETLAQILVSIMSVTWMVARRQGPTGIRKYTEDGKYLRSRINMPTLPATASVTRYEADTMTGFAIHEMGHNICTDLDVWKEACRKGKEYAQILNAFEDPRMELDFYTGPFRWCQKIFRITHRILCQSF